MLRRSRVYGVVTSGVIRRVTRLINHIFWDSEPHLKTSHEPPGGGFESCNATEDAKDWDLGFRVQGSGFRD